MKRGQQGITNFNSFIADGYNHDLILSIVLDFSKPHEEVNYLNQKLRCVKEKFFS